MLANELIDLLERRGLLDQEIIEALRDQLQQSGAKASPEAIAKLLVDNEHLTRFQASKLIGELRAGQYGESEQNGTPSTDEADLGLVDDFGDGNDAVDAEVLDTENAEAAVIDADVIDADVVDAEVLDADVVDAEFIEGDNDLSAKPKRQSKRRTESTKTGKSVPVTQEKNIWDSFKIYGVAGIILLLLVGGFALWWVINSQDSAGFLKHADELYDSTSFAAAREQYQVFVRKYGSTDKVNASKARVRVATTQIYEPALAGNPVEALTVANRVLPEVEDEPGMGDELPALSDSLVQIGERIADRAEKSRDTEEQTNLLESLDQLLEMTQSAKYISTSLRQTLATRLTMLGESRARIHRTINRNNRLAESLVAMRAALDAQETKQAYDVRKTLLRDYPELTDDEELAALILEASEIQQQLVAADSDVPKTTRDELPVSQQQSILLTNRTGAGAQGMANRVIYFQVRGSVMAFEADTGKTLWRRYVGYQRSHLPLPLGDTADAGVLLSDGQRSEVQRLSGTAGEVQWRAQIGEPFSKPEVVGETIYLTTDSGRLLAIDNISGDVKWAIKVPQETYISPGVAAREARLYQAGDHSNLYVIDAKNGSCIESFYLGHGEGSVRVPPVPLLGHLFVIENLDPKSARIHILRSGSDGKGLYRAQPPINLVGNVITTPLIERTRLIVLTDRGEVKVLNVEPTAEAEQVTIAAQQVASYETPTATQMAVDRSQMWITGTRINRYELQMSTGRINFSWIRHAGDAFIAPPRFMDGVLFHARVLKGTKGIRIAAVDPATGQSKWQTDVGVPVAMLRPTRGGVHAVTSQAALYMLDAAAYQQGLVGRPLENPGGEDGFTLRFENPLPLDENVSVMLNREDSGQLAVYDPTRRRELLRIVKLGVGLNRATAPPVISADGILLAMSNGRVLLKDHRTGVDLGSPFQPPTGPEETVNWYHVVPLPNDPEQVVLGDPRGKLYRVRVGDQMRSLAEKENPLKFLGPMTAVNNTLFATTAGPASDVLVRYDINNLTESDRTTLDGRIVWGPVAVGDQVLIRTDDDAGTQTDYETDGTLRAFSDDGKQQWTLPWPGGQPVSPPVDVDGQWVLATEIGKLLTLDPATGELVGMRDFGEPLSAAPLRVGSGKRLFVPGSEGIVYIADVPTEVAP